MNMKETTKAIIGAVGLISLLAMAVFTRSCGPKLDIKEKLSPSKTIPVQEKVKVKTKKGEKVTTLPNGTVIKETAIEKTTVIDNKKNNKAGVTVTCNKVSLNGCKDFTYGVGYERRVFEFVFIGAGINSDGGVNISTGVEF
jgi:hypothetical protein